MILPGLRVRRPALRSVADAVPAAIRDRSGDGPHPDDEVRDTVRTPPATATVLG